MNATVYMKVRLPARTIIANGKSVWKVKDGRIIHTT